jgi:hypothetical protein
LLTRQPGKKGREKIEFDHLARTKDLAIMNHFLMTTRREPSKVSKTPRHVQAGAEKGPFDAFDAFDALF